MVERKWRDLPVENPYRQVDQTIGHDPDYRFSLANERTFLAWIRTALALNGGGLAVVTFLPPFAVIGREVVGVLLITLGTMVAGRSYSRWRSNEEAMRDDGKIQPSRLPGTLAFGVTIVTVVALVLLLIEVAGQ